MARLRYNLVQATLASDLLETDTSIDFVGPLQEGGVDIPTISGGDTLALRIDQEIMHLTAYTAGALTGTVLRAQENTVEADHFTGATVRHVMTTEDFASGGGKTLAALVASSEATDEMKEKADYVCTGTNDEAVLLQALTDLDAQADASGFFGLVLDVMLSPGSFYFDAELNITLNREVRLRGIGGGDNVGYYAAFSNDTYFDKRGVGNFSVIDIGGNSGRRLYLEKVQIYDSGAGHTTAPCINMAGVSPFNRLFLNKVQCYYYEDVAPFVDLGTGGRFVAHDCNIESTGDTIVSSLSTPEIEVRASYLYSDTGRIFNVTSASGGADVRCFDSYLDGAMKIDGPTPPNGPTVVIDNCVSKYTNTGLHAFEIIDANYVSVQNCEIESSEGDSILVNNAREGILSDNVIKLAAQNGVRVLDSDRVSVTDNVIRDYGAASAYAGIILDGDTNDCLVSGNTLRSTGALYGIRVDDSTCDNNVVEDNDLLGSCVTNGNEFSDAGTNTRGWRTVELSYLSAVVVTGSGAKRNRFDRPAVLGHTLLDINTAPAGSSLIADVHRDGTTIYTTQASRPTVADGADDGISSALPDVKYIAKGSYLTADVDQVGSGTPGSDLVVLQRYMPL